MKRFSFPILICLMVFGLRLQQAAGQAYPADFGQVLVTNGISSPTVMAFAPDGRIFVAQQNGMLRVVKNNALLPTPFTNLTVNSTGERGLIGIVLDPDFSTNNFLYLYYTVPGSPAHNRISRFTANGDIAFAGSESIILELDPLSSATNHNGGAMHFGKDGKLYVAIGENANSANAQNLDTYHGKLLRINKDGSAPTDNPFPTGSEQRKRVWAYGLRNPFTFAVHPATGRILLNDVGQNTWEEINDATAGGLNFGWPTTEGYFTAANYPAFSNPIYVYQHDSGDGKGCAITGGTFFYPSSTNYPPAYVDRYFIQDLCNSWINSVDLSASVATRSPFATGIPGNSLSLTTGIDGNLYFLSRSNSALYKIIYNNTTSPFITNQPVNASVATGSTATFSVTALGSTPLNYQWQRNGVPLSGATASTLTIPDADTGDGGSYRVVVSNNYGTVTSNAVTLTVAPNNAPVANITAPTDGTTYAAGNEILFSGNGSDAEDGPIPTSAIEWHIDFHHDIHTHDEPAMAGIDHGSFIIPVSGETSDNVWYRLILRVTDSQGATGKDSVDIFPRKTIINLTTDPPGLQVTLDGQPVETPTSIISVEGILRSFGVVTPQAKENVNYYFQSWSNEGDATQTLSTPVDDITLTAHYGIIVGLESMYGDAQLSLYPNPSSHEEITIRAASAFVQRANIRMVDVMSREVASSQVELSSGYNELPFSFGKVKPGIYSILINMDGRIVSRRLVVSD